MQTDPAWHDNLIFGEYFHGETAPRSAPSTKPAGPALPAM
jgi:hypothetical protein